VSSLLVGVTLGTRDGVLEAILLAVMFVGNVGREHEIRKQNMVSDESEVCEKL
jgi:hypothetical protein